MPTEPMPTTDEPAPPALGTGEYTPSEAAPTADPPAAPGDGRLFADTADFTPDPPARPPRTDEGGTVRSVGGPPARPPIEGTVDLEAAGDGASGGGTIAHDSNAPDDDSFAIGPGGSGFAGTADFAPPTEGPTADPTAPTDPTGTKLTEPEPGATRLVLDGPRYALKKMHAHGGMGEVWLARDARIARPVALKKMRKRMKGKEDQFFWEAQVTGQLEHPGIVPVHELGLDPSGEPFYVMKFVHGKTLLEEIEAFRSAPADRPNREVERLRLLQVFLAMCQTMAFAHSRGVIHRDIKPENVMIGEYGETLVLDWGLAKLTSPDTAAGRAERATPLTRQSYSGDTFETLAGSVKGTPWYMSPEVAAGDTATVDHVSDVYLLGATLYHLLTGKLPREGKTVPELISAAHKPPVPPRAIDPTIAKPLEGICLKAMALERAARYQTAKALAEDVQRYLAGEPVTAYRETFTERAWRWGRRHQKAIGRTLAVLAVAAVAGFGFAKYREFEESRRVEREAAAEELRRKEAERVAEAAKAEEELRQKEAERAAAAAKAALLDRQKAAAADLKRYRALAEEARFLASSTHPATATAAFFSPRAGLEKAEGAFALVAPWGHRLEAFPLDDAERQRLARDLYDLLLLTAQLRSQLGGPDAGADVLARLARAEGLGPPTRSYHRIRGHALAAANRSAEAAAEAKKADDPATPLTAADHFLLGEEARVPATRPDEWRDRTGAFKPNRLALEKAIAEYRRALRTDPSHYWSNLQLGRCLNSLGRREEAAQALGACVALKPDSPWGYMARGVALTNLKRFEDAAADFETVVRLDPDSRQLRLHRGLLEWQQGNTEAAVADFDAALAPPADRQLPEAAFEKATMFGLLGKLDEALTAADRALSGKEPVHQAYLLRAELQFLKGRDPEGLDDLNSFLAAADPSFEPKSPAAAGRRGRWLRLIAQGFPDGGTEAQKKDRKKTRARLYQLARSELQSAADRGGATAEGLEELGRVQELLDRPADALKAYTLALEQTPEGTEHTADRVRRLVLRGWESQNLTTPDLARGRADFEAAIKLAPDNAEAHSGLGYVEACRANGPAARREAQLAVLYGSGDYLLLHNVACVFAKLSETEPARAKEFEDLALDYLGREVELWKRDRTGPNAQVLIRGESAFGPKLRARPEFKRLLTD